MEVTKFLTRFESKKATYYSVPGCCSKSSTDFDDLSHWFSKQRGHFLGQAEEVFAAKAVTLKCMKLDSTGLLHTNYGYSLQILKNIIGENEKKTFI